MIYYWDKKLKKTIACPGNWCNKIKKKKHWLDVSSSKDAFFLPDVFQMTAIALVSVIGQPNHKSSRATLNTNQTKDLTPKKKKKKKKLLKFLIHWSLSLLHIFS